MVRSTRRTFGKAEVVEGPLNGRPIEASRTVELRTLFEAHGKRIWCYFVPFLCCYSLPPNRVVRVSEWEGSTWISAHSEGRKGKRVNLVVPPLPFTGEAWTQGRLALEEMNQGQSPRILWADEEDAAIGADLGMRAEEKENEYVYDPEAVSALAGRGFRDLRKRISRFRREVGGRVRPLVAADAPVCDGLLRHWRRRQGRKHPFLLDWGYTRAAVDRFADWGVEDLRGWVLEDGDRLLGFAMAGPLNAEEACFFVAKSDPDVRGASEFLRVAVYEALSDYRKVNDAGDLGLPGLRRYKQKFRPIESVTTYSLEPS